MGYSLKLEIFEGPLDLLLHLIEKQELDIYDIPVAEVTEQYLDYLQTMETFDLDIASEFLVMAATLLSIKSRMLLPQQTTLADEDSIEDPREELVTKLLEYKKYKTAAAELDKRLRTMKAYYYHPVDKEAYIANYGSCDPLDGVKADDLVAAFKQVLKRAATAEPPLREIHRRNISVGDKINFIREKVTRVNRAIEFQELFELQSTTLADIVITFIALLEMVHRGQIKVYQQKTFGSLFISCVENSAENISGS